MMVFAAAAALIVAASGPASANLLTNGSFENGAQAGSTVPMPGATRGLPVGWSQVAGFDNVDILNNSYTQGSGPDDPLYGVLLSAQEGTHYLDMNGAVDQGRGGIFQDVAGLTAGDQLSLTLYAGKWAQNGDGTLRYSLLNALTNDVLATEDYNVTAAWVQRTLIATVPMSGIVRVRLEAALAEQGAPGLDNVSLTVADANVPEPATLGLLGLGALAIAASRRRKAA